MEESERTPRWRSRMVAVVAASAALFVLFVGGAFAVGHATADQSGQPTASSSQTAQPGRPGGSMMGWSQSDSDDWSWMREHMDDVAWMRQHMGQGLWMHAHPGMWQWMQSHRDDMPWAGQGWQQWNHDRGSTGPQSDTNGSGGGYGSRSGQGRCW